MSPKSSALNQQDRVDFGHTPYQVPLMAEQHEQEEDLEDEGLAQKVDCQQVKVHMVHYHLEVVE